MIECNPEAPTFMAPMVERMTMIHVETTEGTELVPADVVGQSRTPEALSQFTRGEILDPEDSEPEDITGYYARFSAPGYLDATDYVGPADSEVEALAMLAETYDVCPRCFQACIE